MPRATIDFSMFLAAPSPQEDTQLSKKSLRQFDEDKD